mmetsp:Transcript_62300/g.190357  ORF Transcript_62300/g.190357 Transcript_62300/m.190357 type:complete len:229 (+) Transcript_62300:272-958(+)
MRSDKSKPKAKRTTKASEMPSKQSEPREGLSLLPLLPLPLGMLGLCLGKGYRVLGKRGHALGSPALRRGCLRDAVGDCIREGRHGRGLTHAFGAWKLCPSCQDGRQVLRRVTQCTSRALGKVPRDHVGPCPQVTFQAHVVRVKPLPLVSEAIRILLAYLGGVNEPGRQQLHGGRRKVVGNVIPQGMSHRRDGPATTQQLAEQLLEEKRLLVFNAERIQALKSLLSHVA